MRFEFNKLKDIGINEYSEYLELVNIKENQILNWLINNMFYETLNLIYNTPGYDIVRRDIEPQNLRLDYLFSLRRDCYDIDKDLYFYTINERLFNDAFNDVSKKEKVYVNYRSDRDSMNKISYWRTFRHDINYSVDIPGEYLIFILCRKIRECIINVDLLDTHLTMNIYDTADDIMDYITRFISSTSLSLENNFVLLDNYVNILKRKIKNGEVKFDENILKLERII